MKQLFTALLIGIVNFAFAQSPFITQWKTNNPGISDDFSIQIPLFNESLYDFEVDWGDGSSDIYAGVGSTLTVTHTYGDSGVYYVAINGSFPGISFYENNDKQKILDILQWGDIQWESFHQAFFDCINIEVNATDAPDLTNVTNMTAMFWGCQSFNQPVNHWDVSNVEMMSALFRSADSFNQPLDMWDVSNVVSMAEMFLGASSFNQPIESWNVSSVTNMREMFGFTTSFNQPIGTWDVSNVTDMALMFEYASVFNQPIGDWDVSNVASTNQMFRQALAFNQPLNTWTLPGNVQLTSMFSEAVSFNQPLDLWDVSNVANIGAMFRDAISFNQPLDTWNVSATTGMGHVFWGATSFDQSLASWDVSNVETMASMLRDCGMTACNYDATLSAWAELTPQYFVTLGSNGLKYTSASATARQSLIDNYLWMITGDELVELTEWVVSAEASGTTVIVSASGGTGSYTYSWSGPNGFISSDSSIVAPYNGTYTVVVSDGCEEWTDTFEILTVGVNEHQIADFHVFPNPATRHVEIYTNSNRAHLLQAYDMRGSVVAEASFNGNNQLSLNLDGFNAGLYILRISDSDGHPLAQERLAVVR